jgi:phosphoribosylformylglycinamidine synthase
MKTKQLNEQQNSDNQNDKNLIIFYLKSLISSPNLASKQWIFEQYDSKVMNDTISTGGDAAIIRIRGSNKAIAISTDCNPRYVAGNPFEGAKQAVAETYRNISAVGAKPLAITNCLNFGNPQKPEIMGQIVKAIQGINEACITLDYPVVSGNVSLYNETDGKAIFPTPAIGGVGLISDLNKRSNIKFNNVNDKIIVIGKAVGHLDCSLFKQIIKNDRNLDNPPIVDLEIEKKHSLFVRELIANSLINSCHDISDGGLLVTIFEMCSAKFGCRIGIENLKNFDKISDEAIFFGEEQSRYIISVNENNYQIINDLAKKNNIDIFTVGKVINNDLIIQSSLSDNSEEQKVSIQELIDINQSVFPNKFA